MVILSFGIVLGLLTNYLARRDAPVFEQEARSYSSPPVLGKPVPAGIAEPERKREPQALPEEVVETPRLEEIGEGTDLLEMPEDIEEPAETIEENTPAATAGPTLLKNAPETAPPPPVTPDTTPVGAGTLPPFTPVASATGPVPGPSQVTTKPAVPFEATTSAPPPESEEITGFVPQASATGPVPEQKTKQLPQFTPVSSKAGPVKTE